MFKNYITSNFLIEMYNKRYNDHEDDLYFKYGFLYFSSLIYCFCKWLEDQYHKNGYSKIVFLTREGAFLKKYFDCITEKKYPTDLMYISRKSLYGALIKNNSIVDIEEIGHFFWKNNYTKNEILDFFSYESYNSGFIFLDTYI